MANEQARPAVEKGFRYVKEALVRGTWRHGEMLPSIQRLAAMAGVSRPTMIMAMARLREKQLVHGMERHRARAGSGHRESEEDAESLYPWEQKLRLLRKDMASGAFGLLGALPPFKALQRRYGACYRTVRRMLRRLESEDEIIRRGRGFVMHGTYPNRYRSVVCFITCRGHLGQASALNRDHNRIANLFENECLQAGLRLEIIEVDFYDPSARAAALQRVANRDRVIGYLFDIWWYLSDDYRRGHLDLLDRLASLQKPVAILDEIGNFDLPERFLANSRLQVYRIEGQRAGTRVAKHLLALGCQSAGYFTLWPDAGWSVERFAGICEQFARAGCAGNVSAFAVEQDDPLLYLFKISGLTNLGIRKVIAAIRPPAQADNLWERWLRFERSAPSKELIAPEGERMLRKNLSPLARELRQGWDREFLAQTCITILDTAGKQLVRLQLEKLFAKALAEPRMRAWICAADSIAFPALAFLREQSIRVPEDISLISFDNTPATALEQRLTTFDFNGMGFVRAILNFVVRPQRLRGSCRHAAIEIAGMIIERGTTAAASGNKGRHH